MWVYLPASTTRPASTSTHLRATAASSADAAHQRHGHAGGAPSDWHPLLINISPLLPCHSVLPLHSTSGYPQRMAPDAVLRTSKPPSPKDRPKYRPGGCRTPHCRHTMRCIATSRLLTLTFRSFIAHTFPCAHAPLRTQVPCTFVSSPSKRTGGSCSTLSAPTPP